MRLRAGVSLLAAAAACLLTSLPAMAAPSPTSLPPQPSVLGPLPVDHAAATHIKHVFVIVQEGHSFDNYFGTYPGASGISRNTPLPANPRSVNGGVVYPHHITSVHTVPLDNSAHAATQALDGGAMDGFVAAQSAAARAGSLALGYYTGSDLPYYWALARRYVLADDFFSSALGGSAPNFQFLVGAQEWNVTSGLGASTSVPTIFNRLDAAGVSWGYYAATYKAHELNGQVPTLEPEIPMLSLSNITDSRKDMARIQDLTTLDRELVKGGLPQVTYVVRPGQSEHAPGNISLGEVSTAGLINAIMRSRYWKSSAIFVTWSDWGGWYDSVVPPRVDVEGDGFRVPLLIVSPFAKRGALLTDQSDSTSILKFLESLYGLAPLTTRDQNAALLTDAFDFGTARPPSPVALGPLPATALTQGSVSTILLAYGIPLALVIALFARFAYIRRRRQVGEVSRQ
ncbi:MAG: alkaline phosphatase family protein [Candidatus Dormibacteria bacterium]